MNEEQYANDLKSLSMEELEARQIELEEKIVSHESAMYSGTEEDNSAHAAEEEKEAFRRQRDDVAIEIESRKDENVRPDEFAGAPPENPDAF